MGWQGEEKFGRGWRCCERCGNCGDEKTRAISGEGGSGEERLSERHVGNLGWRDYWGREDVQVVGDSPVREKTGKTGVGKEEWNGTGNREDSREDGREGTGNREGGREYEIGKRKSEGRNYDRGRRRRDVFLGGEWRREIGEEGEGRGGDEREVSSGRKTTGG